MLLRLKIVFIKLLVVVSSFLNQPNSAQAQTDTSKVVEFVETIPEFPNGIEAMYAYLNKQIVYPKIDVKNNVSGKAVVKFKIDSLGFVKDAQIVKSVSPTIDAESLRVINNMPQWKPGTQQGKAVNVIYTIPISFNLQAKNTSQNKPQSTAQIIGEIIGGMSVTLLSVWLYRML